MSDLTIPAYDKGILIARPFGDNPHAWRIAAAELREGKMPMQPGYVADLADNYAAALEYWQSVTR